MSCCAQTRAYREAGGDQKYSDGIHCRGFLFDQSAPQLFNNDLQPNAFLSNIAQTPSSHASRNYFEAILRSPKCGSIRPFDKGSDISA
jgi:hypothetical protein